MQPSSDLLYTGVNQTMWQNGKIRKKILMDTQSRVSLEIEKSPPKYRKVWTQSFTLELWFRVTRKQKIEDISQLKWVAFDNDFKSCQQDKGFKLWTIKGITAWCTLEEKGELESFQNMKDKYDLWEHDFHRYLQLRDY